MTGLIPLIDKFPSANYPPVPVAPMLEQVSDYTRTNTVLVCNLGCQLKHSRLSAVPDVYFAYCIFFSLRNQLPAMTVYRNNLLSSPRGGMYIFCGKRSPSPSFGCNSKVGGGYAKKKKTGGKVPGGSSEKHAQTFGLFLYLFNFYATPRTTNITTSSN